jgi:hypothetical protein
VLEVLATLLKRIITQLLQTRSKDMKHTFGKQARRAGSALAAAGAFAVLGIGTAQAAEFASADITIEPRGEAEGGLTCTWRETGVGSSQVVYYACTGGAVGALYACTYRNRVIFNSPTQLDIFKNVTGEHGAVPFLSLKNGQINAATTTPIPTVEAPVGQELCLAPTEQTIVAVRWCNASLTDVTNNLVGATMSELFRESFSGVGTVPSCAELLASP